MLFFVKKSQARNFSRSFDDNDIFITPLTSESILDRILKQHGEISNTSAVALR